MEISKVKENDKLTVAVSGRVDTVTSREFDSFIEENIQGINELVLDLKDMSYTSSAGLRVILKTHKAMSSKGGLKIINVQSDVMEIFDITGFSDILDIE